MTTVRESAGWTRLDRLRLIRVAGPNRVKFLHNLLSNDIANLNPGQGRLAALMNLKGQQVAWMRVLSESDALICELPSAVRDIVVETFVHYKVGAPVRFEKPDDVVFGVFGAQAEAALKALGLTTIPGAAESFTTSPFEGSAVRICRAGDMPAGGFTFHVEAQRAAAMEGHLRARLGDEISPTILDAMRVEEGLPWHGIDVMEENLLHETGQLHVYHSSSKGCYLGQEVVARLEGRGGNVNKKLVGLKGESALKAGAEISAEGKVVGRVTSAGASPRFGPIAMGYVHRSHAEVGTKVLSGGVGCEVTTLPFRS